MLNAWLVYVLLPFFICVCGFYAIKLFLKDGITSFGHLKILLGGAILVMVFPRYIYMTIHRNLYDREGAVCLSWHNKNGTYIANEECWGYKFKEHEDIGYLHYQTISEDGIDIIIGKDFTNWFHGKKIMSRDTSVMSSLKGMDISVGKGFPNWVYEKMIELRKDENASKLHEEYAKNRYAEEGREQEQAIQKLNLLFYRYPLYDEKLHKFIRAEYAQDYYHRLQRIKKNSSHVYYDEELDITGYKSFGDKEIHLYGNDEVAFKAECIGESPLCKIEFPFNDIFKVSIENVNYSELKDIKNKIKQLKILLNDLVISEST